MSQDPGPSPELIVIAGPNGAGKSTTAPLLLRDSLQILEFVNADTIIRRFERGLTNFFSLYRPVVDDWRIYNGAAGLTPQLIAAGAGLDAPEIADPEVWASLRKSYEHK